MSIQILNYKGTIRWKDEEFTNPRVFYSERLIPYGSDLVLLKNDSGTYSIEPFKKQARIIGVVTQVKDQTSRLLRV